MSVITFLTKFSRAFDPLRIHEDAAAWLFRELTNSPTIAAINARLALSPNDTNKQDGINRTYAGVVSHLLRRYSADTVTTKADELTRNFKQVSLAPSGRSHTLSDVILRCGGFYNEQILCEIFLSER